MAEATSRFTPRQWLLLAASFVLAEPLRWAINRLLDALADKVGFAWVANVSGFFAALQPYVIGGAVVGLLFVVPANWKAIKAAVAARFAPQQKSGLQIFPPTVIQHPPPRYTAAEVDRRVEIIDKVISHINDPKPSEHAAVFKDANRIRVMLTDEGPDVVRARAGEFKEAVSQQELAIRQIWNDYAMLDGAVPQNVVKLDYKQRLQDRTEEFTWAVSCLPSPVIDKTTELVTRSYLYDFVKAIAQYEAWIADRKSELTAIREGILKALV